MPFSPTLEVKESNMSSYSFKAKNKETGEIFEVRAMDDYFGHHRYGYKIDDHTMTEDYFNERYEEIPTPPHDNKTEESWEECPCGNKRINGKCTAKVIDLESWGDTWAEKLREKLYKRFGEHTTIGENRYASDFLEEIVIPFITSIVQDTRKKAVEEIDENTSDGYHTFKELYDHRITLYIALCKSLKLLSKLNHETDMPHCWCNPKKTVYENGNMVISHSGFEVWRSKRHADGELCFGTGTQFIMGVNKMNGEQISYHIPIERWSETEFAETLEQGIEWDGHSSEDVINRLQALLTNVKED